MGDTADMEDPEPTEDREEWMRWADNRIIDLENANAKLTAENAKKEASDECAELEAEVKRLRAAHIGADEVRQKHKFQVVRLQVIEKLARELLDDGGNWTAQADRIIDDLGKILVDDEEARDR